jgi:hypothetical protein
MREELGEYAGEEGGKDGYAIRCPSKGKYSILTVE